MSVDEGVKFKHKTVLSMPIKYSSSPGRVLGVFQLVNKLQDLPFTSNDENFLEAFAIFCGMGITNVRMYETACEARAKQQASGISDIQPSVHDAPLCSVGERKSH